MCMSYPVHMGECHEEEPSASALMVCLLDVLGFATLLGRVGLAEVISRYRKLIGFVREQTGGVDLSPTPDGHVAVGWLELGNSFFSDTVLFWSRYNPMGLRSFTLGVAEAVCVGLEIGLPLRGAVTVGEAVMDANEGVFVGDPVVEAARVERAQQWVGVSFGPSFTDPGFGQFHLDTVLPFKSHYKDGVGRLGTGMTVDWPRHWRETRATDPEPVVRDLDIDPRFAEYYGHAIEFAGFSERNHDWFRHDEHLDYG